MPSANKNKQPHILSRAAWLAKEFDRYPIWRSPVSSQYESWNRVGDLNSAQ